MDNEGSPSVQNSDEMVTQKEKGNIDKFFEGPWNSMVYKLRWLIIFVFLAWTIVATIFASQIGPLTEEEEFLPSDHPIMIIGKTLGDEFDGKSDKELMVYLYWGVKGLDKEGGSQWDSNFIGKAIMDDKFDMGQQEAQNSILRLCEDLRQQEFVVNKNVKCWLEIF